jgi:hypothetical protein
MRLTPAQIRFLRRVRDAGARGDRTPFLGNREAGRAASAWYRTAYALAVRGLVRLERTGDARTAWLTNQGAACITALES